MGYPVIEMALGTHYPTHEAIYRNFGGPLTQEELSDSPSSLLLQYLALKA
jgi:hypothetical protein